MGSESSRRPVSLRSQSQDDSGKLPVQAVVPELGFQVQWPAVVQLRSQVDEDVPRTVGEIDDLRPFFARRYEAAREAALGIHTGAFGQLKST